MAVESPVNIEMHVVQSRVHERLFGAARAVPIGRFAVLGSLGAGGMGIVFAAHDPELDRKVAIKLVAVGRTGSSPSSQARLLAEAQTMARLSHPNIVAVHEVGTHEGGVYVAMEYIDGETLGQWLARVRPSWSQIVDAFVQAGQGLAAAHREGVVHRDFKPGNAMIDRTGRVRVLDFGLAIDESKNAELAITETSDRDRSQQSIGGTPLYMAPEQLAGAPASIRTDQYAFCVALWTALFGAHPFVEGALTVPSGVAVPAWLRRVLQRGLGPATSRWPSMEALLEALARGRASARRRRIVLGAAAVVTMATGILAAFEIDEHRRVAACERAGASIDDVWNDDARVRLRDAVLGSGASYAEATAAEVVPALDRQAESWRSARTQACLDVDVRRVSDAGAFDRALWCLDGQRMELDVFVAQLERDPRSLQSAVVTATGLSKPQSCLDDDTLRRLPAPPSTQHDEVRAVRLELVRADAIARSGNYAEALQVVRASEVRARDLEWAPLFITLQRREASLLEREGEYAQAEKVGREAFFAAAKTGAWDIAAAAALDLAYVVGMRLSRHGDALDWVHHAEVADAHVGDPLGLREARRLSAEANVRLAMADYGVARELMERSLALLEAIHGPDHPIVGNALGNLGTLYEQLGELERARALQERTLAIRDRTLGPDHPDVAGTLNNLASTLYSTGDLAGAAAAHERALAIRERAFGPDHPIVAKTSSSLAAVLLATGERARARELQTRALAILEAAVGQSHPDVAVALLNLGALEFETGHPEAARTHYERAVSIHEASGGDHHPNYALTLANLAEVRLALHDDVRARAEVERALVIFGEIEGVQDGEADARFIHAKAIVANDGDLTVARREAAAARASYLSVGAGMADRVAAVDAWLVEHGAGP